MSISMELYVTCCTYMQDTTCNAYNIMKVVIESFTRLEAYDEGRGDDPCLVMFCNDAGVPFNYFHNKFL